MDLNRTFLVTGAGGLVGHAISDELFRMHAKTVVTPSSIQYDLRDWTETNSLFRSVRPDYVFHCAAKVGGIMAHTERPVEFFEDNTLIQLNVLRAARQWGVEKLLFLASACAYPKFAPIPIREEMLLTGVLEPSNELYALAKISGSRLCDAYRREHGCNFITAMPTNMYGRWDNYHPTGSHVIPGMIHKIHTAHMAKEKKVVLWGTGNPKRDFLNSKDAARAFVLLMNKWDQPGIVNVSSGRSVELHAIADEIRAVIGYEGEIEWDRSKPDGTPDRTMDNSLLRGLGWAPTVSLARGLEEAYADYLLRL